jgi:hypothetical protein
LNSTSFVGGEETMIVRYELVHHPPLPRKSTTADVRRCVFVFEFEQVRSAIAEVIASHFCNPNRPGGLALRDELVRVGMVLSDAARCGEDEFEVGSEDWKCWWIVSLHLLGQRQFNTASCELCGCDYSASQIGREPWESDGVGGSHYLCPKRHVLYSFGEWIS